MLFTTELGGGRGHLARLNAFAKVVKDIGFTTCLALRGDRKRLTWSGDWYFDEELAAPAFPRLRRPPPALRIDGLAGALARVGFIDSEIISKVIDNWAQVLGQYAPTFVVGDFAPFVRLACLDRLPTIIVGSGYTVPGPKSLHWSHDSSVSRNQREITRLIQEQLNRGLSGRKTSHISTPSMALRGDETLAATLPHFDPVWSRDHSERTGPFADYPVIGRSARQSKFLYAYLHSLSEQDLKTLKVLRDHGHHIIAYSDQWDESGPEWLARIRNPLSTLEIIQDATAVYHAGGLGLATSCAVYGVPQILAPRHTEAKMTAEGLVRMRIGQLAVQEHQAGQSSGHQTTKWLVDGNAKVHLNQVAEELSAWVHAQNWRARVRCAVMAVS